MKIDVPPEMYGNNPAGFIDHLGLVAERRPIGSDTVWEVSAKHTDLVSAQTLHGPGRRRVVSTYGATNLGPWDYLVNGVSGGFHQ